MYATQLTLPSLPGYPTYFSYNIKVCANRTAQTAKRATRAAQAQVIKWRLIYQKFSVIYKIHRNLWYKWRNFWIRVLCKLYIVSCTVSGNILCCDIHHSVKIVIDYCVCVQWEKLFSKPTPRHKTSIFANNTVCWCWIFDWNCGR